ncbi:hypothetical protein AGOR_G00102490 [Albula goreensis]|uniref:Cathepsin propeptide inhibitor domain-containing protein n=1 Tax=Albula goreensis TaxID=1534307 RepID=A0A8T3DG69_9TELE|nr:hypothetical protein AGOR_G00102490 [Albula goreensis]
MVKTSEFREPIRNVSRARFPSALPRWSALITPHREQRTEMAEEEPELEFYDNNSGDVDREFEEWKQKFKKSYGSPEEEARRKKLWLATRVRVTEHNRKYERNEVTWCAGVNQFADLAEGEHPCGCMH